MQSPDQERNIFRTYTLVNTTPEEMAAYDLKEQRAISRTVEKPIGTIATTAHLMKSALGAGILGGPLAYKYAGFAFALAINLFIGLYLFTCLLLLGIANKMICKRSAQPKLSYSQLGEAAINLLSNERIQKYARAFRFYIDFLIMLELFGACVTYQLIVARTIKQLAEDSPATTADAPYHEGGLHLRHFLVILLIPFILICLIRHLKYLAPFSMVANFIIAIAVFANVYYAHQENPKFESMDPVGTLAGCFQMTGIITFSMSCACQILTVENNMRDPNKYTIALSGGYICIVLLVMICSFFGYAAYLDEIQAPMTINYPLTIFPKILKSTIAIMIYITHGLNFFVPFTRAWAYIRHIHKSHFLLWEYFWRILFVVIITMIGLVFPKVTAIMSFLGCFCLANMGFIFPSIIHLLAVWEYPGLGTLKWRLWMDLTLITIGIIIWLVGTYFACQDMLSSFSGESI